MKSISVDKQQLLATLRENRDTHQADYELAWDGYKEAVLKSLRELLRAAKRAEHGETINVHVPHYQPESHVDDYDRVIQMLEWDTDSQVTLDHQEFQQFVQDNWHWKHQFQTANVMYAGSASPSKFRP